MWLMVATLTQYIAFLATAAKKQGSTTGAMLIVTTTCGTPIGSTTWSQ